VTGADPFIGPQVLTLAIPLGSFLAGLLWLFFVRRPNR
jgi:hypothetical protein